MRALLPLRLEGRGTGDIEALPSYLSRLAAEHGVTPGGLFLYLLNGYEGGVALGRALAAQPFAASVRPNTTTERAIDVLTRGRCETGDQLRRATFLFLSPALARSQNTYSRHLRWCPGCLYEQSLAGSEPYIKLVWLLDGVRACHIHRVVLRDICPHCKRHPRPWSGWPSFAQCPHCHGALDRVSQGDRVDLAPEASAPDLASLVEAIANRTLPFSAGAVNRYVDRVFDEAWASQRELVLWEKLPRDECLRYSSLDEPITLAIARRIAFRLEVSILELLDPDHPTTRSFGFAAEAPLPAPLQPGRKVRTIDRYLLAKELKSILEGPLEPISMPNVARRLSVSVGAIHYHCPSLAKKLTERCAAFKRAEAGRKRVEAIEAVRAALLRWPREQTPLTKKAILRRLRQETNLPKNLLIAEVLAQWNP